MGFKFSRPWSGLSAAFVLALAGTSSANHAQPKAAASLQTPGGADHWAAALSPWWRQPAYSVTPSYLRAFYADPTPRHAFYGTAQPSLLLRTDLLLRPGLFYGLPQDAPVPPVRPPIRPMNFSARADACPQSLTHKNKFSAAVLRIDVFGNEYVEVDAAGNVPRHPASLVKMMSMLLVFQALEEGRVKLDDTLHFSARALSAEPVSLANEFAQLGMKQLSLEHTLQAVGTKSANDAAIAMAEHVAGSESAFVDRMNALAAEIGMSGTIYKNASGLPDEAQVTTANDQAILLRYIQKYYPQYLRYLATPEFAIPKSERVVAAAARKAKGNRRASDAFVRIKGHLALLGKSAENGYGFRWGKTGYVHASGFNLAVGADRPDGTDVIAVVLGGKTPVARDQCIQTMVARL